MSLSGAKTIQHIVMHGAFRYRIKHSCCLSVYTTFLLIHSFSQNIFFIGKNIPFIFYIVHIFCPHTILCCTLITTNISIFNKKDFTEHPKSLYPQEPGSAGSLKRSVIWLSLSRFKTSPHIRPSPLDNMYKIF